MKSDRYIRRAKPITA